MSLLRSIRAELPALHRLTACLRRGAGALILGLASWLASMPAHALVDLTGISKIAAAAYHTCALTVTGGVKCWGWNGGGQLGDNSTVQRLTTVDVSGLSSGVIDIAVGDGQSCALTTAGGVKCWGWNADGELGDGTTTQRLTPVDVLGFTSGVTAIAMGRYHSCLLTTAGGVKCWGWNGGGQLGDNSTTERLAPVDVSGLGSGVKAISAGDSHTCALTTSGGVKCWGWNAEGELGDNSTTQRLTPVDVAGLSSGIASISAGFYHSCALTIAGGVKCWGVNIYGQLGDNTTATHLAPVDVSTLGSGVTAITTGGGHNCALTTAGGLKCWGFNYYGQVGDNTTIVRLAPVDVPSLTSGVASAAAGGTHTCAVTTGGGAKCWGGNDGGQLGDNTYGYQRLTPTDVSGLASSVAAIAGGWYHTCALTTTGGVKCWGQNDLGQLGDNSTTNRLTPTDVTGLTSGVTAIATGLYHSCAITTAGAVKCWGKNDNGQLGDNSIIQRLTPVDVSGLSSGVVALRLGFDHTCALTTSGGMKCWGANSSGQLGDGTNTNHLTPIDVPSLTSGVTAIALGAVHTCAVVATGGVKCWGANGNGQMGNNTTTGSMYPVDVSGLASGVTAITAGFAHTCARTTSGGVKCWGMNDNGQLGDNSTTQHLTPVDVFGLTSGVSTIAGGAIHTCALTTAGGMKCWGSNSNGQVGNNATTDSLASADVSGLTSGVAAIAVGGYHTCALTTANAAKCWGANYRGQVGDGTAIYRPNVAPVLTLSTVPAAFSFTAQTSVPLSSLRTSNSVAITGLEASAPISVANGEYSVGCTATFASTISAISPGQSVCVRHTSAASSATTVTTTLTIGGVAGIFTSTTQAVLSGLLSADFDGDGKADLLWQHTDGSVGMWLMNGTTKSFAAGMIGAGSGWSVKHVADFNGDGKADLLWQHTDGSVGMWLMNGTTKSFAAGLIGAGSGWSVEQVADFNGDGKADLIWQHTDGSVGMWLMNGTTKSFAAGLRGAGSGWSVTLVADFNGDGKVDILWQHTDGSVEMWLMNGAAMSSSVSLIGAGSGWSVTHVADFNGDGKADLIWQHTDGSAGMWLMNGTNRTFAAGLIGAGSGWSVKQVADFNGDSKADLIWQHTDGSAGMWLMNGTTRLIAAGLIGPASGWSPSP